MSSADMAAAERDALAYLQRELGPRAPQRLALVGEFDERPLEGEGPTRVFAFEIRAAAGIASGVGPCGGSEEAKHYVAAGQTEPNYFPAYGMSADDAYSFHVGTRYMVEMGIQRVDGAYEPPGARAAAERIAVAHAAGRPVVQSELAGLFRCEDQYFAVYRMLIGELDVYCMGGDCPTGFYELTKYPPQMALRLHLGKVIRSEAREEQRED
jgi:hypothetical protein